MFHVPISAPTASRMKIALIAVVTPPIAASATAADGVAVLERDQARERGAQQQRDLQRPVGGADAEEHDRQRDQPDQHDHGQERVEQARRLSALRYRVDVVTAAVGVTLRSGAARPRLAVAPPRRAAEQQPPGLGHRDDREPDARCRRATGAGQVDGVEDPLEEPELGAEQDRRAASRRCSSRNILSSSTSSEKTERRSSRVVSEKKTLLIANVVRPIVRATALSVVVVGPRDHAERGAAHARARRSRPRSGAAAAGSARRRRAACASSAPRPGGRSRGRSPGAPGS